jgi:hypothetical protein
MAAKFMGQSQDVLHTWGPHVGAASFLIWEYDFLYKLLNRMIDEMFKSGDLARALNRLWPLASYKLPVFHSSSH